MYFPEGTTTLLKWIKADAKDLDDKAYIDMPTTLPLRF